MQGPPLRIGASHQSAVSPRLDVTTTCLVLVQQQAIVQPVDELSPPPTSSAYSPYDNHQQDRAYDRRNEGSNQSAALDL